MTEEAKRLGRTATLTIDAELISEAEALSLDVSRAAEDGISSAIQSEKARLWRIENRPALEAWNEWVEENGIPLSKFRQF